MVMEAAGAIASVAGDMLGFMKPKKVKLICEPKWADGDRYAPIEVMFNPPEYTLVQSTEVERNSNPNTPGGTPQYKGTTAMTLTMDLFFDDFSSPKGDVTPKITRLMGWTVPVQSKQGTVSPVPPLVGLDGGWGNEQLKDFFGFIKGLKVNYTLFRMDGTPVQAKVGLTIEGAVNPATGTNPTSRAAGSNRIRTLTEGDTLQSIAYRELGKATYWRAIADLNGIDDPLRVQAGTTVIIPTAADAAKAR